MKKLLFVLVLLSISTFSQAAFVVHIWEDSGDTLVSGSGTLDLTGLILATETVFDDVISPGEGLITGRTPGIGIHSSGGFDLYTGLTSLPGAFSGGLQSITSDINGDSFGVFIFDVIVPSGYVSGDHFAGSMHFSSQTLGNLSLSEYIGTYVWSLPNDSFTLYIGTTPVPIPSSLALMTLGLVGIGFMRKAELSLGSAITKQQ